MEAISHDPKFARTVKVPQSVGKDFAKADDQAGITKTHDGKSIKKSRAERMYGPKK